MGSIADNGWLLISLKSKTKVNFKVGGLVYRKGKRRKGGGNFLQLNSGEVMLRN